MSVSIIRVAFGESEWADAIGLRREVLRRPLGLDFSADDLSAERGDTLFSAFDGQRLVGVVMLRHLGSDSVKLRQMAVSENMRGQRVGEQLVAAFEAFTRQLGVRRIDLAARKTAIGFYQRLGYIVIGDEYIEVTIPHLHMRKSLPL